MNNVPEFIPGDNDCINMTRKNREVYPGGEKLVLMNRDQAADLVKRAAGRKEVTKEQAIMQLAQIVAPMMICAAWILGAMEGLADPVFTGVITGVCMLWAMVNYKWGNMNA
jgi:hypothetical protein